MSRVRYSAEQAKNLKGKSDSKRLKAMTDEDINSAAASDRDSAVLSDDDLGEFQRSEHKGNGIYAHKNETRKRKTG